VAAAEAEPARARFLDLFPDGFEEASTTDGIDLTAYTDESGERRVRAAFDSVVTRRVEPGWEDRWREFHRPVVVGGLWVGPPWERPPAGTTSVIVEPARAFGTGAHPTTRACIELLARCKRGSVLDVGCGSGVLSIAARKLGFEPVLALDVDPVAVEATRSNAERNGVEIDVRVGDALRDELPEADVLLANIELRAVEAVLARWEGRCAIASGYLVREALRAPGWERELRLELEGWAAERFWRVG
jgi:ribosomal protein L11 methyltransferase